MSGRRPIEELRAAVESQDAGKVVDVISRKSGLFCQSKPKDSQFTVILMTAIASGSIVLVESLLLGVDSLAFLTRNECLIAYESIFNSADRKTRKNMLKLLVARGLDIRSHEDSRFGKIINMFVDRHVKEADDDYLELVELLRAYGVEASRKIKWNLCFLCYFIKEDNLELVSFLINKGADVNHVELWQTRTPLHHAASSAINNADIVALLLSKGADINARDSLGCTPLLDACVELHKDVITLLIEKGANVCIKNKYGVTPLSMMTVEDAKETLEHRDSLEYFYDRPAILLKELSKLHFEGRTILEEDVDLIESIKFYKNYFDTCIEELEMMADTNFHASYSYYTVFSRSISMKMLANLTKNEKFAQEFRENINLFSVYKNELIMVFEEAIKLKDKLEAINCGLRSAFVDYFPDVVIRKLIDIFYEEDLSPIKLQE